MPRVLSIIVALLAFALSGVSQERVQKPFKGTFFCEKAHITLELDLYEESVEAPGLGFLGKMHGCMFGRGVYGTWLVTSATIDGSTATIRMSNDTGADAQTILFRQQTDSLFTYKASGGNNVRKAQGRKLVKIEEDLIFRRIR